MKLTTRSSKVSHTIRSSKVRRLQAWLHLEWYDDLAWAAKRYEWEGNGGCMDCGIGVQGDVIQQSCPVPHLKTEILRHCISKVLFSKIMELLFKDLLDLGYRHCHEDERCGCLAQCVSWVLTSGNKLKDSKQWAVSILNLLQIQLPPQALWGKRCEYWSDMARRWEFTQFIHT